MPYINDSTPNKIEGKFYALQTDEHLEACKQLTKSQLKVLYYLKTLDPYGNRFMDFSIKGMARKLELSRMTISRAFKALENFGYIDLELIYVRVSIRVLNVKEVTSDNKNVSVCNIPDAPCNIPDAPCNIPDAPCNIPVTPMGLETLPDKGFNEPKNIKNIKTNKNLSLPDKEREKFLEFANKKVDELPKRPQLPKKWIEKNHDELWAEYQELEQRKEANEQRARESIDQQQDTVVDPRIAADLENGKILQIDHHNKMFRDTDGWWQKWHEYDEWKARQQSDCQAANEELLMSKQLISAALGIESS